MSRTKAVAKPKISTSPRSGSFRSYKSALRFLTQTTNYETLNHARYNQANYSLARMNRLLSALGSPHKKIATVHIAGTKGKGSTAAMLSNMLQGCGYDVGVFSSPHVLDIRERITVNDTWISEQQFTKLVNKLVPVYNAMKGTKPTFFELITAMSFLHFLDQEVDLAVIEAGLGGRLDATNVIRPEVCGITSISFDHMAQLGNTLSEIAEEKGGIFKPHVPAISAPQEPAVEEALRKLAGQIETPLQFAGGEIEFSYRFESSRIVGPHTRVCLTTSTSRFEHLHVPMLGEHQAINCGLALGLLDALKNQGLEIDDQKAIDGLAKVRLPGRAEIIQQDPKILVDGAHNPASIAALMRTVGQHVPYDSMIVIFGCQQGKDIEGMVRHVQLGADKIIFTQSASPHAVDPKELAACYVEQSGNVAQTAPDLEQAMQIARSAVGADDLICITGSFYLVGEAKRQLSE